MITAEDLYRQFTADTMPNRHVLSWEELPQLSRDAWEHVLQTVVDEQRAIQGKFDEQRSA